MERDFCKVIGGAPTTFQGYEIERNRLNQDTEIRRKENRNLQNGTLHHILHINFTIFYLKLRIETGSWDRQCLNYIKSVSALEQIVVQTSIGINLIYCLQSQILLIAAQTNLGPVVQSIVSLTSSLRGQLVKCFTSL